MKKQIKEFSSLNLSGRSSARKTVKSLRMREWLHPICCIALSTIFTACGHSESAQDLAAALVGAQSAYAEAGRTGQPTQQLAGDVARLKMKLQLMADAGDPNACEATWIQYHAAVEVQWKSTDCDPRQVIAGLKENLKYAQCAIAKKQALSADDRENAERQIKMIPHMLGVLEPQYAAQNNAVGACYVPNLR